MPEPLKHLYNETLISSLARALTEVDPLFEVEKFQASIFCEHWQQKELKARMRHIAITLHDFLPDDYQQAIEILKMIAPQFQGFEYMFFPDYVELYGLDNFAISIAALEFFTPYSSSEFAVRPFIKKYKNKMMAQMETWASSDHEHVRRLASEGCRPRLPWAMALPVFKKDPTAVLTILEHLKDDPSQFVRRSVANNLNDISKDHPQLVMNIAKAWLGNHQNTDKLVKHACRSLLKQGKPEVLRLFGFNRPDFICMTAFHVQSSVEMGKKLAFSFTLNAQHNELGKLRIEYAIDFMKKNGRQARKVFHISESYHTTQKKVMTKIHSFKQISTRKYYTGNHVLAVIVNGVELAQTTFVLRKS